MASPYSQIALPAWRRSECLWDPVAPPSTLIKRSARATFVVA